VRQDKPQKASEPKSKEEVKVFSKKNDFNPDLYRFKKSDYNFKQENFKAAFYENNRANKTKINQ